MENHIREAAEKLLKKSYEELTESEQRVLRHIVERRHIARHKSRAFEEKFTLGQRVADRIAAFGGSWPFIIIFLSILLSWITLNAVVLARHPFDPYPFILLNLVLSMVAALQAPVIMMSQNRQSAKDRADAAHDYEVNLKAELEIMRLHEMLDGLLQDRWAELIRLQEDQISLLQNLAKGRGSPGATPSPGGTD